MIVPMTRASVLFLAHHRDRALEALRALGLLHLEEGQAGRGGDIDSARARLARLDQALARLAPHAQDKSDDSHSEVTDPDALADEILVRAERLEACAEQAAEVAREIERIRPWGDFDPAAARALEQRDWALALVRWPQPDPPPPPEDGLLRVTGQVGKITALAALGPRQALEHWAGDKDCAALPEKSLSQIEEQRETLRLEDADLRRRLGETARRARPALEAARAETARTLHFLEVREGLRKEGAIAVLTGWCPEPQLEALRGEAARQGWGLKLDPPGPEDQPPTLMRFPAWLRPMRALYDFLEILPGYREGDVSLPFLVFFSLFFAMLIGDAGYGALILGGTLAAGPVLRRRGLPRYPLALMGLLGASTVAWGLLTGNVFGIEALPAPLQRLEVDWLNDRNRLMGLCFFLGALQLSLAHGWNALLRAPQLEALAQLGWAAQAWVMFLAARALVLGGVFPGWAWALGGTGLLLVLLFQTPWQRLRREWIQHAMLPLDVISLFVDVISYVRLFAVGMATLSVAQSFNRMAMDLGFSQVWTAAASSLILVLGHGLNLLLCALGVLVHGVRLNTLEFSMHKGIQWSGRPYRPFADDIKKIA